MAENATTHLRQTLEKFKMSNERTSGLIKYLGPIVIAFGCFLFGSLGVIIGNAFGSLSFLWFLNGAAIWVTLLLVMGVQFVPQAEVWGVERFEQYHRMLRSGMRFILLPGFIDRVKETNKVSLKDQRLDLYKDETNNQFDFLNGSAPVKVQVWFHLVQKDASGKNVLEENLVKWLYAKADPHNWIEEQLDDFIRPEMQKYTIDEAQTKKQSVATMAKNEMKSVNGIDLEGAIGVEVGRLLITDIVLSQDVIDARTETLKGEREAQKRAAVGKGYGDAIAAIISAAKASGKDISWEDAQALFEKQSGLETIGRTGANITLVGENVGGVLKTLDIGNRRSNSRNTSSNSPNPKPKGGRP